MRIGERQRQVQVVVRVVVHRAVEDPGHAERQAAGQRIRLAAVAAAHAAARRVELWLRHRSGKQRQQVGRIAAVQRQLHDALVVHHLADAEVARLHRLRVGSDGNGFLYRAKLQRHRHVRIAVDLQHDAGLDGRAEPLQRDIETIRPNRESGKKEQAVGIGDDFAFESGVGLRRGDVGARKHRAARILHRAGNLGCRAHLRQGHVDSDKHHDQSAEQRTECASHPDPPPEVVYPQLNQRASPPPSHARDIIDATREPRESGRSILPRSRLFNTLTSHI